MADVDPKLVQAIAAQVLAALRAANAPVDVHAPIGICTGDYSKFPELRGRAGAPAPAPALDGTSALPPSTSGPIHPSRHELYSTPPVPTGIDGTSALPPAAGHVSPDRHRNENTATGPTLNTPDGTSPSPPPPSGPVHPSHAPITAHTGVSPSNLDGTATLPPPPASIQPAALKGVITVSQLRNIKGAVRLAKGAILTPLAADYIKDRAISVISDEAAPITRINSGSANPAQNGGEGQTYWWIDGQCPSVAKVVDALRPNILASRERNSPDNLRQVVKELAGLVKNKRVSGALLFVGSAARAACYANRCASLRAIVGTSDKTVSEAIELLGANVLIIEFPLHGFKSMMAMVKPFVESTQLAPLPVQKELDELRLCG